MDNKTDIKVSVIMPIYNAHDYIRPAMDSVLYQTLPEIDRRREAVVERRGHMFLAVQCGVLDLREIHPIAAFAHDGNLLHPFWKLELPFAAVRSLRKIPLLVRFYVLP